MAIHNSEPVEDPSARLTFGSFAPCAEPLADFIERQAVDDRPLESFKDGRDISQLGAKDRQFSLSINRRKNWPVAVPFFGTGAASFRVVFMADVFLVGAVSAFAFLPVTTLAPFERPSASWFSTKKRFSHSLPINCVGRDAVSCRSRYRPASDRK
ncbi:hypothetical protein DXM29_04625 [Agrobacterium tumefaciens]|nr:hypothetical protein DXM29_04625 [Agrobacterium tumefaciens]